MARAIDASHFGEIMEQWKKDCLESDDQHGADVIADVILQLDDMPTLTQPNEPLTLDELRGMDGEPVLVDDKKTWALLQVWDDENIDAVFPMPRGCFHAESVIGRNFYRRPPEGEGNA